MKKLVVRTSFITLGVCLILLLSLFGVLSLLVPYEMVRFTSTLGLETLSGDYAYQEYERSGDIDYLARSFEIAADRGGDRKADDRFKILIAHEGFEAYCALRDSSTETNLTINYKDFIYGRGACVKYRLASSEAEKIAVCEFALDNTEASFPSGNPVMQLTVEAANRQDSAFCALFLAKLQESGRNFTENKDYTNAILFLEECANEQNR